MSYKEIFCCYCSPQTYTRSNIPEEEQGEGVSKKKKKSGKIHMNGPGVAVRPRLSLTYCCEGQSSSAAI